MTDQPNTPAPTPHVRPSKRPKLNGRRQGEWLGGADIPANRRCSFVAKTTGKRCLNHVVVAKAGNDVVYGTRCHLAAHGGTRQKQLLLAKLQQLRTGRSLQKIGHPVAVSPADAILQVLAAHFGTFTILGEYVRRLMTPLAVDPTYVEPALFDPMVGKRILSASADEVANTIIDFTTAASSALDTPTPDAFTDDGQPQEHRVEYADEADGDGDGDGDDSGLDDSRDIDISELRPDAEAIKEELLNEEDGTNYPVDFLPPPPEPLYGPDHLGDMAPHVLWKMYQEVADKVVKTSKTAIEMNVLDHRAKMEDMAAQFLIQTLIHLLDDPRMRLTVDQRNIGRTIVIEHMDKVTTELPRVSLELSTPK